MAKREHNCLYFADDKDILDLILSAPRQLPSTKLFGLLRKRGIFLSEQMTREDLAKYMSQLSYDWMQLEELLDLTESSDKKEKTTSRDIKTSAVAADVKKAIDDIKNERKEVSDEVYQVVENNSGGFVITVQHVEIDSKKNRLLQSQSKVQTIEVEKEGDSFKFRYNSNNKTNEIVADIVAEIQKKKPVEEVSISLKGIVDPRIRTKFFVDLMNGMKGFGAQNVLTTRVHKMNQEKKSEDAEDDNEDAETEDEPDKPMTEDDEEATCYIKTIALSGNQVLSSKEYQFFSDKEFYTVQFVWKGNESSGDKHCYEFEAEFKDAENASSFHYGIRGYYEFNQDKGSHLKSRAPCNAFEHKRLYQLIEEAAKDAVKIAKDSSDENQ